MIKTTIVLSFSGRMFTLPPPFEIVPLEKYRVRRNRSGGPQIVYKNHTYNSHRQMKSKYHGKYWACSSRISKTCHVSVIRREDGSLFIRGVHNHPPNYCM